MACKKSTLKKYRNRPSPPYPAQECRKQKKKGSDGKWYISIPDKSGVYRWKRELAVKANTKMNTVKERKFRVKGDIVKMKRQMGVRSYLIHNNGGRPYRVEIGEKDVVVYSNESEQKDKTVYRVSSEDIWLGDNLLSLSAYFPRGSGKGNSILIKIGPHQYVYIGHIIYSFKMENDEIVKYYSPIGNGDVPYPYAVGKDYVYFLLDKKRVAIEDVDITKDGYTQFYRNIPSDKKRQFSVKMIDTPKME
jgi:hypothetical protein